MSVPRIELVPRRQEDLVGGGADYLIYAGEQMVGRIYQTILAQQRVSWFWGVNGVFNSNENGITMTGQAEDLEQARQRMRDAFDKWLPWAMSLPRDHLSIGTIDEQLRKIGAR